MNTTTFDHPAFDASSLNRTDSSVDELLAERAENGHTRTRPTPRTSRSVLAFFAAAGVTAAALLAAGALPRVGNDQALAATTQSVLDAREAVTVVSAARGDSAIELRLPGSTSPLQVTTLFARTNGYVKRFHADIGDHVSAGAVLAEIENPEVDEQLREAQATQERTVADLALVSQRLTRTTNTYNQRAASKSELDDLTAQHNSAIAAVRVAEATVARLAKEQSFQKVVAPFDGVIAQRSLDLGSLVTSGSSSSVSGLFRLEQDHILKIFVDVPQTAAPSVAAGQTARIEVREFPGRTFPGKVVRTARSIDPATRTLRAEIHVANDKDELLPGMYVQAILSVPDPRKPLRVPAATLAIDAAGIQVVTVDSANKAVRQTVTLGRDFGKEVEVLTGLRGDEKLVVNPRDDLRSGDAVAIK